MKSACGGLNARNRYKSDRDCERRRADIQRPFAMPGIEGGGGLLGLGRGDWTEEVGGNFEDL